MKPIIKKVTKITLFLGLLSCSGCASIVDGSVQSLSVRTIGSNGNVDGASCQLKSNKGTWFVQTPGTVSVHRSYDALNVKCTRKGYQPSVLAVKSATKSMAFGNILAGGIIGAAVDMSTGAAYDYPSLITVRMARKHEPPVPPQNNGPASTASAAAKPTS